MTAVYGDACSATCPVDEALAAQRGYAITLLPRSTCPGGRWLSATARSTSRSMPACAPHCACGVPSAWCTAAGRTPQRWKLLIAERRWAGAEADSLRRLGLALRQVFRPGLRTPPVQRSRGAAHVIDQTHPTGHRQHRQTPCGRPAVGPGRPVRSSFGRAGAGHRRERHQADRLRRGGQRLAVAQRRQASRASASRRCSRLHRFGSSKDITAPDFSGCNFDGSAHPTDPRHSFKPAARVLHDGPRWQHRRHHAAHLLAAAAGAGPRGRASGQRGLPHDPGVRQARARQAARGAGDVPVRRLLAHQAAARCRASATACTARPS